MEGMKMILDDGSGKEFDAALKNTLPGDGFPRFITKDRCTVEGRPGVMIAFGVRLPDGTVARAQTVLTMRLFNAVARAMLSKYPDQVL